MNTQANPTEDQVKVIYHDGDGSCFLYDKDGNHIEGWPENWPDRIAHVRTFCESRGIGYRSH
jgi:hypothetical protein